MSTIDYFIYFVNYGMLSILILGTLGNVSTFIVYRSETFKTYSVSIYFLFMAVTDSLTLASAIIVYIGQQFNYSIFIQSRAACKLATYVTYVFGPMSAWLTVMVSVDRFFNIVYPRQFPFIFKSKLQIGINLVIIAFNLSYYTFILVNNDLNLISSDIDPVTNQTILSYLCSTNNSK